MTGGNIGPPALAAHYPTVTQVQRGSTFALRCSTLDFCLGGRRSLRAPALDVQYPPRRPPHREERIFLGLMTSDRTL